MGDKKGVPPETRRRRNRSSLEAVSENSAQQEAYNNCLNLEKGASEPGKFETNCRLFSPLFPLQRNGDRKRYRLYKPLVILADRGEVRLTRCPVCRGR